MRDGVESLERRSDATHPAGHADHHQFPAQPRNRRRARQAHRPQARSIPATSADALARLNPEAPIERVVKYWGRVSHASIKLPGGLVKFEVRAFSPQDVKLVADTTLELVRGAGQQPQRPHQPRRGRARGDGISARQRGIDQDARRRGGRAQPVRHHGNENIHGGDLGTAAPAEIVAARSLRRLRHATALHGGRRGADARIEVADRRPAATNRQTRGPVDHGPRRDHSTRPRPRAIPRSPRP